jgi:hypothetical protein
MTEGQRVYIHFFRSGRIRRVFANQSKKDSKRHYTQLDFSAKLCPEEDRDELTAWMKLVQQDLEGRGIST